MAEREQPRERVAEPAGAGGWAQRGMGAGWQYRFFYWVLRLRGKAGAYRISAVVTFWYALLYPSIRRRTRFYLDRRFPGRRGGWGRFVETYRLIRTYGQTLVDMMAMGVLGAGSMSVVSRDHERLLELCGGERGCILLHAHVGCWQVAMSTLGELPKRIRLVMIPEARTAALLHRENTDVIDPRTGLAGVVRMTEALLAGQVVGMMGDRTFGDEQNSVRVRFLGGEVALPVTPYRLASATGTPVLVLTAPKIEGGAYELRLSRVIEVPAGLGREAKSYGVYAQEFADCIEQFVKEYPWQYYNFYDLWSGGRISDF